MSSYERIVDSFECADDKIWFVREVEAKVGEEYDRFLAYVLTRSTGVLVKMEALRGLEIRDFAEDSRDVLAEAIVSLLNSAEDEVVQQHCASALRNFWKSPTTLPALRDLVSDSDRDLDSRYNALDSIAAHLDDPEYMAAFRSIAKLSDEIGNEARAQMELSTALRKGVNPAVRRGNARNVIIDPRRSREWPHSCSDGVTYSPAPARGG